MSKTPLVDFEKHGAISVATIRATRVLDAVNVNEFGREILDYIEKHPETHMLINFCHVHYLSSAVLTELLRIKDALEGAKGSLRLCSVNKDIRRVFEITNLDKVFVIYDDVESGVPRYERALALAAEDETWTQGG
ncbi:MAG: STAS domain-containing protein [Candidatus Hydrogenedentota bacterium]